MKKQFLLLLLCLFSLHHIAGAQIKEQAPLSLSHNTTTSLVFPFAIKSVDRGSPDILAQVPREAQNVLQVKTARKGIPKTNLTVITSDGKLYAFPVYYAENPAQSVVQLPGSPGSTISVRIAGAPLHEAQLKAICHQLEGDSRFYHGIRDKNGGVKATLEGVYTYGNTLFYRVVLTNRSPIPYDLAFLRLSIRDTKKVKRTATQEADVAPLYIHGLEESGIAGGHARVLLIATGKTTLTRKKKLVLDIFEQQGGRHLELQVRYRHILQAPPLLFTPAPLTDSSPKP